MSWRRWKLGAVVAVFMSLIVAGAGLSQSMNWRSFIAVFCSACATHFGAFITNHPIEQITSDTEQFTKPKDTDSKL